MGLGFVAPGGYTPNHNKVQGPKTSKPLTNNTIIQTRKPKRVQGFGSGVISRGFMPPAAKGHGKGNAWCGFKGCGLRVWGQRSQSTIECRRSPHQAQWRLKEVLDKPEPLNTLNPKP